MRHLVATILLVAAIAVTGPSPVAADPPPFPEVIPLPDGFFPEGIAVGKGTTFYVGSLIDGSIYRGDLRTGAGEVIVSSPGGLAVGIEVDRREQVWVAGGFFGTGVVYDGRTGAELASYVFPSAGFINDVVVTDDAAYFTDSFVNRLFVVPLGKGGKAIAATPVELPVTGAPVTGDFQFNGIETSTDGKSLIVAHSTAGVLVRVDPSTGSAITVDLGGDSLPSGDGIVRQGNTLYVVQNASNEIAVVALSPDASTGTVVEVLTDPDFDVPTTADVFGNAVYAVNARFSTPPLPTTTYDVVRVERN